MEEVKWNPLEIMALRADRDSAEFQFMTKMKTREQINFKLIQLGLEPLE